MKLCLNSAECMCKKMKTHMNNCVSFANGLSIKNDSDIDFKIKSKHKDKPLFNFKYNCHKEFRLLPIIGVILGALLILTIISDSCKSDCDCKSK